MDTRNHTLATDLAIAGGALIGGLLLGAGIMAVFDPQMGRTRRSFAGQKARRIVRRTGRMIEGQRRNMMNRSRGMMASTRTRMKGNDQPPDMTLMSRIRSIIGRVASHPHSLDVQACSGKVIVWGPILETEATPLLNAIRSIPGVMQIEDQLQRHSDTRGVSALQGGRLRPLMSRRRSGMLFGGMGTLLGLGATAAAAMVASRMSDTGLASISDRIRSRFQGEEMEPELDEIGGIDQMERTGGSLPDWIEEREEHIVLDRRR